MQSNDKNKPAETKIKSDEQLHRPTPKTPPAVKPVPNDGDLANPVDGQAPRVPNPPAETESWGNRQAREARENEKAAGQGKPEPHPHG